MTQSLKELLSKISTERARLVTILTTMTDGLIMTDHEGKITLANKAAGNLFGFKEEEVLGNTFIQAVHNYEIWQTLSKTLAGGEQQTSQVEITPGRRFLRVIATTLKTTELSGALVLFQDLTELRALQTMRRELVGNISHELRTPLTTIKAIVETLQDGALSDKDATCGFLSTIDKEVDRLTQMLTELTELSRIESGKVNFNVELMGINSLIEEAVSRMTPQADRQDISFVKELDSNIPAVRIDKDRIYQVLINLLHNAIKFSHPGGEITVSTGREGKEIIIRVTDTGIGIPAEDLPHIFERFYKVDKSRSSSGTGLGLAIAKHTIQAHNGRIWVESIEGEGSSFYFSLPL